MVLLDNIHEPLIGGFASIDDHSSESSRSRRRLADMKCIVKVFIPEDFPTRITSIDGQYLQTVCRYSETLRDSSPKYLS